jgi:GNAT superfamily N-acetyltransferase
MDVREIPEGESHRAAAALLELRPHLETPEDVVAKVDGQRPQGYRLAGSFAEGEDDAVCVAGFRVIDNLVSGRQLYVDDLVTRKAARSGGHGAAVLAWLEEEARRAGCATLELDSNVTRFNAHRFYFREGLVIAAHHFGRKL